MYTELVHWLGRQMDLAIWMADALCEFVIKFPRSRGVSGALYLQSAIAGVISEPRVVHCRVCPV